MAKNKKVTPTPRGKISPAMSSDVQLIEHGRDIHMFRITDVELDALTTSHHSLNLFFFSLCLGALIVFVITLVTIALPDRTFATFIALTVLSVLLGIYFGLKALGERRQINRGIRQIRESRKVYM